MTAPVAMNHCPTEETLAAFIDDRLDRTARQRVIEHMANCAECRDTLMVADELRAPTVYRFQRRFLLIAGPIAAALILAFTFPLLRDRFAPSDMKELVTASSSLRHRPTKARLSAEFPYQRYTTYRSSESPASPGENSIRPDEYALAVKSTDLLSAAGPHPSAEQNHAIGVSHLLLRKPVEAKKSLEAALQQETGISEITQALQKSEDPALLNDLAVTYQELINRRGQDEYVPLAVQAVQRAWSLQKSPQIAFTRALVLQSANLREQAIAAWETYLKLDPGSGWREDAERELSLLKETTDSELWPVERAKLLAMGRDPAALRPVVNRFRQEVRLLCEEELLVEWGEFTLGGDSRAANTLADVAALGEALRECNGERDILDAVDAIRRAAPPDRLQLARGHVAYGRGRAAIRKAEPAVAMREMNVAVAALQPELTPFARRARIEHAAAVYLSNDYQGTLNELAALPAEPAPNVALARTEWIRGITRSQMGAPEEAIGHYRRSLDVFQRGGENDNMCMLHSLLAGTLENAGDLAEATQHRNEALRLLAQTGNDDRRHVVMFEAAYAAIVRDTPAVADALLDTVVAHDVADNDPFNACTALMFRSAYRFRRGVHREASDDLGQARRYCETIDDPRLRERAMANFGLAHATLHPNQTTANDLRDLDTAVAFFRETKNGRWLRTAYLARARALTASGAADAAERDFRAALDEVANIRKQIEARDARVSFTATADEITDGYIEFLLSRNRDREAFELADRSRFRDLVDSPVARWADDASGTVLAQLQRAVPRDATVIEYRVLGQSIAAWVIGKQSFVSVRLPGPMDAVSAQLRQLSIEVSDTEFRGAASSLYELLLRPLENHTRTAAVAVVIPDGTLERVPFAALYDQQTGRYVVETQATVIAPSAALFLQSVARLRDRAAESERMVVIEAASAGRTTDGLPDAAREAQAIATMFPHARIASGVNALRALTEATSIHFTGHNMGNESNFVGAMRLAEGTSAQLSPSQIVDLSLPVTRMVYLSACDTDHGPIRSSEGGITAARSFFAAGVPVVVATLWPVDDTAARQFAHYFYQRLREGESPAEALRAAQLKLLSGPRAARPDWAAFRVIGAGIGSVFLQT